MLDLLGNYIMLMLEKNESMAKNFRYLSIGLLEVHRTQAIQHKSQMY